MNTTLLEQTTASQIYMEPLVLQKDFLEPIDIRLVDFEDLNPNDKSTAIEMFATEFCNHLPNGYQVIEKKLFSERSDPVCMFSNDKIIGVGNVTYHDYDLLRQQLFYKYENSAISKKILISNFEELMLALNTSSKWIAELDYSVITHQYRGLGLGSILFEYRLQKIIEYKFADVVFVLTKSPLAGKVDHWKCILDEAKASGFVDPSTFIEQHSLRYSEKPFNYLWGSPQITKLAIRHKFAPIGFSKNLSPLWIKTLEN